METFLSLLINVLLTIFTVWLTCKFMFKQIKNVEITWDTKNQKVILTSGYNPSTNLAFMVDTTKTDAEIKADINNVLPSLLTQMRKPPSER